MKIVGMLPVKNEEWILPTFLSNVMPIVDELIVIDDDSTDNSKQILEAAGAIVKGYEDTEKLKGGWPCGLIRSHLFRYAREAGGTHFLCLDADETFTTNFVPIARDVISQLKPGQKIAMHWLALWQSYTHFRHDNTVWSNNWKDFIVCDDPALTYDYNYMAEGRTIGSNEGTWLRLPTQQGAVMHYQFATLNNFLLKQAWCQCGELVQKPGNSGAIRGKYAITLLTNNVGIAEMPPEWYVDVPIPEVPNYDPTWDEKWFMRKDLLPGLMKYFDDHGAAYFHDLDIWHIPQLRNRYIEETGKEPR
jgi:hypothetical protein